MPHTAHTHSIPQNIFTNSSLLIYSCLLTLIPISSSQVLNFQRKHSMPKTAEALDEPRMEQALSRIFGFSTQICLPRVVQYSETRVYVPYTHFVVVSDYFCKSSASRIRRLYFIVLLSYNLQPFSCFQILEYNSQLLFIHTHMLELQVIMLNKPSLLLSSLFSFLSIVKESLRESPVLLLMPAKED